jgi:class 3 adenylate cyclase/tetratricopeptide (TPR) repeat protein
MQCPKCQFKNRESAKFCKECGANLELACSGCGTVYEIGSKFCDECGQDLSKSVKVSSVEYTQPQSYTPKFLADKILTTRRSIEGERKLVTVLFADVANYTSMSERLDPEEIHQIMDGCFKILMDEVHKYEGTINQFTGDGVMALFGAPVAHEDHAQRACHAALSIQNSIGKYGKKITNNLNIDFRLRIGINSGTVVVGAIGDDLRMDYTAIGDTTNLASRMEGAATPGTILVSENTHKLTKTFFEFNDLEPLKLKGKDKPQHAYRLIKSGAIETRIEASVSKGLTRFVGRKNSLAALSEALKKASSGSGQVVGIVGEAGVGKSRLILELKRSLPEDQYTYLEGRCLNYGGSIAYLPVIDIIKKYFDIKDDDQESEIRNKLDEKALQLDENLKSCLPPLQKLLSLKVEDERFLKFEPQQKKDRIFEAVRDVLIRESQNNPLVLVVEDLHWIDKTTEQVLDYLINWLAKAQILLILLYRPEYTHQWGSKSYYHKIGLDQLTYPSSVKLVQAILDGCEIAPELEEIILNRSSGNPLFIEELTHNLLESGSIDRSGNQCVLAKKASEIQVPDTIQGIIAARIDRIEDNLKRIMQVASVIGREFAYRILHTITGTKEELKSHLLNLQGLEFIYEKSLFPELEYIFKHALTQEVTYNSLLLQRRKEIHEKIGVAIETLYSYNLEEYYELLAYHYGCSNDMEKTLEYAERACLKAENLSAMDDAKNYFGQAMGIIDKLPDLPTNQHRRISLLAQPSRPFIFQLTLSLPEYYGYLTQYKSMALTLEDKRLLGAFLTRLASCEWWFGHLQEAIQNLNKAFKFCEESGSSFDTAASLMSQRWAYFWHGDYAQIILLQNKFLSLSDQKANLRGHVLSLGATALAFSKVGRWDDALKIGMAGLEAAENNSNDSLISHAAFAISLSNSLKGDLDNALKFADMALDKAPTIGDSVYAQTCLAWALSRRGELEKAIELGKSLIPMYQFVQFVPGEVWITFILGEAQYLSKAYDEATQIVENVLVTAENCEMKFFMGWGYRLLGEIALKTDSDQAEPQFKKSIEVFRKITSENELALAYTGSGHFFKQQGNTDMAKEYLTKALEIFERLGTLREPDAVRKELNEIQ